MTNKDKIWETTVGMIQPLERVYDSEGDPIETDTTVFNRVSISASDKDVQLRVSEPYMNIPFQCNGNPYDYRMYDYKLRSIDDKSVKITARLNVKRWNTWKPHFEAMEAKMIHINNYFDREVEQYNKDTDNKYVHNDNIDNGIGVSHPLETLRYQSLAIFENFFHSMVTNLLRNEIEISRS